VVLRPLFEALPQAEGMAAPWRVPAAAGLLIGIGLRGRLREGTAWRGTGPTFQVTRRGRRLPSRAKIA
jgi:hypothetical protein